MPGMRGLMATAALVWLGKAIAGEGRLRGVRRRSVAVRHRADPGRRGVHCSRRGDAGPSYPAGFRPGNRGRAGSAGQFPIAWRDLPGSVAEHFLIVCHLWPGVTPHNVMQTPYMFWCLMVDQAPSWLEMSFGRRISL